MLTGDNAIPLLPNPMVYVFIPYSWESSLAILGSINPELLTPSVSRMITLLLALLSFNLLTEVAKPIPIAVPLSITLLYSSSSNARKTTALSLVTEVKVKLTPAYTTRPILSDGRPLINSAATSLNASRRFGLRSRASILAETSIARTISIPWVEDDLVVTSVE